VEKFLYVLAQQIPPLVPGGIYEHISHIVG